MITIKQLNESEKKYYGLSNKEKEFEKAINILEKKLKKLKEKTNEKVCYKQHQCGHSKIQTNSCEN